MKPLSISLILFLFFRFAEGQGQQTASALPDPPYLNHIYHIAADSLISLEQIDAHMIVKPKAFGFGGSESGFSMHGDKSPVRIKATDTLRFVIKIASSMMDPGSMIRLYVLNSKKGNREAILDSHEYAYYHSKDKDNTAGIPYNVQKLNNEVFVILPASRLASGEYAFMNSTQVSGGGPRASYIFYAFGIDP
jgi:hypothetical protein